MKFAIATLLASSVALGAWAQEKNAEITTDPLTATILERIIYDKRQVCLLAGVVSETTRAIFACSHEGSATELERSSIFELGSLSKVFAGLLLADMVRAGELAIDDPASKYSLPGAKLPARDGREITLRQLVTHTASLPGMPPGILPAEFMRRSMSGDAQVLYDALAKVELDRAIGAEAAYSNLGFLWLADILALAAAAGIDASMGDLLKLAEALAGRRKTPLDETIALAM